MDKVPVIQADWDRADAWRKEWANCQGEHTALVQAFARHRIAALEEAAKVAEDVWAEAQDTEWDTGFNYARQQIATAIRALKEQP